MLRERLKEFIDFVRNRHSTIRREGGCDTCGHGSYEVGEDIDVDDMMSRLDSDIDDFINEMKEKRNEAR